MEKILIIENKKEEKFLRQKTKKVDPTSFTRREMTALLSRMRKIMRAANGVGLSANQIGMDGRFFVAEVPMTNGELGFYAVFNPKIEKVSSEKNMVEEGCLSIPGSYGPVSRPERVTLSGLDKNGKPIKIKAWGLLARVFQHEVDHLDGKLFIDKAESVQKVAHQAKQ